MTFHYEQAATDARQKAATIELILFTVWRLLLFVVVTGSMGWVLRCLLESLLLALEQGFSGR